MDSVLSPCFRLLPEVAKHSLLSQHPLILLDIGCSGGIHAVWSHLGPNLIAHGYDQAASECEKLAAQETRQSVRYHGRYIGLPDGHPFLAGRLEAERIRGPDGSFSDTSASQALEQQTPAGIRRNDYGQLSGWTRTAVASVDQITCDEKLEYVDVLKIDVDGAELEIVHSAESTLQQRSTTCVLIEVNYTGHEDTYSNTFANTDRLLRRHGFDLGNLSIWRYSLRHLPSPFKYRAVGETVFGAPFIGDAAYFRCPKPPVGSASEEAVRRHGACVLKLAALYEMFGAPDLAARLLVHEEDWLEKAGEKAGPLLDLLVPAPFYPDVRYPDYIRLFQSDIGAFFPP